MPHPDPRIQPRAYITDGTRLFQVIGASGAYGRRGCDRVDLEDCRTFEIKQYSSDAIRQQFRLVRAGPAGRDPVPSAA